MVQTEEGVLYSWKKEDTLKIMMRKYIQGILSKNSKIQNDV